MVTYQAHCAIAQPGDLWSILAELGGRQLGLTGDLADDFLDLVHGVCYLSGVVCCLKMGVVGVEEEKVDEGRKLR